MMAMVEVAVFQHVFTQQGPGVERGGYLEIELRCACGWKIRDIRPDAHRLADWHARYAKQTMTARLV